MTPLVFLTYSQRPVRAGLAHPKEEQPSVGRGGISSVTEPTLSPAITPTVQLSITVIFVALLILLFLTVYVQLWLILWYRHRPFSYQSVLLFICLVWASLRIVLFSMYFRAVYLANHLPLFLYWLLYCFPVCLQFFNLCLIIMFFISVYFKGSDRQRVKRKLSCNIVICVAAIVFFITNISFAMKITDHERRTNQVLMKLLYARIIINDGLFLCGAIVLCILIIKLSKVPAAKRVLEAKGISSRTAVIVSVFVILMYGSRSLYNCIAVMPSIQGKTPGFGFGWINVSDQADVTNLGAGYAYLSFITVLFVWEIFPLVTILVIFRVRMDRSLPAELNKLSQRQGAQYFTSQFAVRQQLIDTHINNEVQTSSSASSPRTINLLCSLFGKNLSQEELTSTFPPSNASLRYGTIGINYVLPSSLYRSPTGSIQ